MRGEKEGVFCSRSVLLWDLEKRSDTVGLTFFLSAGKQERVEFERTVDQRRLVPHISSGGEYGETLLVKNPSPVYSTALLNASGCERKDPAMVRVW